MHFYVIHYVIRYRNYEISNRESQKHAGRINIIQYYIIACSHISLEIPFLNNIQYNQCFMCNPVAVDCYSTATFTHSRTRPPCPIYSMMFLRKLPSLHRTLTAPREKYCKNIFKSTYITISHPITDYSLRKLGLEIIHRSIDYFFLRQDPDFSSVEDRTVTEDVLYLYDPAFLLA